MATQRYRRKPQLCVLCKEEETRDWDHICYICRGDWQKGRDLAAVGLPVGTVKIKVAHNPKVYHFLGTPPEFGQNLGRDIIDAMLKLVQGLPVSGRRGKSENKPVGIPDADNSSFYHDAGKMYVINGDEESEHHMRNVIQCVCDLMASAYKDGERRGQSFVTDLAEGKLTTKDLERL